jgi:hypothetical protein
MTPDGFRRLALRLPEATEGSHFGHPDFRVGGRIFASLGYPDPAWAVVRLTPEQQEALCHAEPEIFLPVKGGWGRQGATNVRLRQARVASVRAALVVAWRNAAPRGRSRQAAAGRGGRTP